MRRGGRDRGSRGGARRRRAASPAFRDRRFGGVGRRVAVRRGNRRLGGALGRVSLQSEFADVAFAGGRAALVTVVRGSDSVATGAKLLVRADGASSGSLGDADLEAAARADAEELIWIERCELREHGDVTLFVDVTGPPPRLVVFGAIDFAVALCRLAKAAGWRAFVVDPRSRFATPERFPEAEAVIAEWPAEALARLGGGDPAAYPAVLPHHPQMERPAPPA